MLFSIQSFCQTPQTSTGDLCKQGPWNQSLAVHPLHIKIALPWCPSLQSFLPLCIWHITGRSFVICWTTTRSQSPLEYRLVTRHGNSKKVLHNTLPVAVKQEACTFIVNYATKYALPLPGCMPTVTNRESGQQAVGLTLFKDLWPPNIHVMKSESDLCTTCQRSTGSSSGQPTRKNWGDSKAVVEDPGRRKKIGRPMWTVSSVERGGHIARRCPKKTTKDEPRTNTKRDVANSSERKPLNWIWPGLAPTTWPNVLKDWQERRTLPPTLK